MKKIVYFRIDNGQLAQVDGLCKGVKFTRNGFILAALRQHCDYIRSWQESNARAFNKMSPTDRAKFMPQAVTQPGDDDGEWPRIDPEILGLDEYIAKERDWYW